jgi:hypothetical protein
LGSRILAQHVALRSHDGTSHIVLEPLEPLESLQLMA